jgi:hypothetical protein
MENTSGQGKQAVLPAEMAGWSWNWGAFFFNWVWGIFNKTYIALLMFVPVVNIVMPFILGLKGNAWAWRNKTWESYEHFRRVQRKWAVWGVIVFLVSLLAAAGGVFYIFEEVKHSEPYVMAMDRVQVDREALKVLGTPIEPGWWWKGDLSAKEGSGQAALTIPVKGAAQQGVVHVKATQTNQKWKLEQLFLVPAEGGAPLDLLKTRRAQPAPVPAAASAELAKATPPDTAPVIPSSSKDVAPPSARARKEARKASIKKLRPSRKAAADISAVSDHGLFSIHLKNGGRFVTPQYWEENQEIRFYIAGGVMGVEKRGVLKIRKIAEDSPTATFLPLPPAAKPDLEAPAKDEAAAVEEKLDIQAYRDRKDRMTAELDRISANLREATRRKDQEGKTQALEEMRQKSAQIYDLTDEVTKKNKGRLPDGWWKD